MKELTLKELQKKVDDWANQFKTPYFSPLSRMAVMTEEVGEVARVMNRIYGDKPNKDTENIRNLEEELADLLFSIVCTANAEKIDLNTVLEEKFQKVNIRDKNRWERKNPSDEE